MAKPALLSMLSRDGLYPVLVKMVPAGHQSLLFISWEGKVKDFGDITWFAGGMKGGGGDSFRQHGIKREL